jgi:hypothetical protein
MTSKFSLLAGASVGAAMIAFGAAPSFAAKPVHHAKHRPVAHRSSEIEALRAQVEALTARLDAQESNSAQATAAINNAQAQAAAANSAAQAAEAQAAAVQSAVPGQVKTALASQPKPKPQWFDSTSISGRAYFNFSNVSQKLNGIRPAGGVSGNGTGFDIKRFYLGIDHTFSPVFSANLTMDISNVVGNTSNYNFPGAPSNGSTTIPASCVTGTAACTIPGQTISNNVALVGRGFYVKKAYLQAKLNPAFIIRAGSADLPWVPWVEGQYGYRHIENVLIDRTNFGTSADWGLHVLGDLAGGLISYQFSAIDGGGYRNVKVTKTVDFEGRVSMAYKGFFAGVGGYTGKRGNDTQSVDLTLPVGLDHVRNATRIDAAGGYKSKLFTIAGEYFHAKNWNNTTSLAQDKSDGYSVFGSVNFYKTFSVFGRYDWEKPSKELNPTLKDDYFNAGIQWEPVKIVDLAIVYKHEKINNINGIASYAYGFQNAPGLSVPIGGRLVNSEIGLFGQLRF